MVGNVVGARLGEGALAKTLQLSENYSLGGSLLMAGDAVRENATKREMEANARALGGGLAIALGARKVDQWASPNPCPTH